MKPEVILFSRTPQKDYGYLFPLPRRLSHASRSFLQCQLEQMQNGSADGILRFFLSDTDALLLRLIPSGCSDVFSRPIYSLEGLWCSEEDIRKLWLCLPLILPGFFAAPSLYSQLVRGEETCSIPFEQLLDVFAARTRTQDKTAIRRLSTTIYSADTPISFSFDTDGIHPDHVLSAHGRARWTPCEVRRCRMKVFFLPKEKSAHLEAISCGTPSYTVLRGEDIALEHHGWSFSRLEASACAIEQALSECGWPCAKGVDDL